MDRLEQITGDNWQQFIAAPTAVLMLGRKGCPACAAWTEELQALLAEGGYPDVRFGKLELDGKGLMAFKRDNLWLASVDGLPYNVLYHGGERTQGWAGGGAERLTRRLDRVLGSQEPGRGAMAGVP